MTRSFPLIGTNALLIFAALMLAGCGVGSGGPESKISETTDTYLRSLASGDSTKACAPRPERLPISIARTRAHARADRVPTPTIVVLMMGPGRGRAATESLPAQ